MWMQAVAAVWPVQGCSSLLLRAGSEKGMTAKRHLGKGGDRLRELCTKGGSGSSFLVFCLLTPLHVRVLACFDGGG